MGNRRDFLVIVLAWAVIAATSAGTVVAVYTLFIR